MAGLVVLPYLANRSFAAAIDEVMWIYVAQDYWQDPKILFCPSAKKVAVIDGTTPNPPDVFPEWGHTKWAWYTPWAPPMEATGLPDTSSYGVNDWASVPYRSDPSDQENADQHFWGRLDQENADQIPLLFDSVWYAVTPLDTSDPKPDILDKYHNPYTFGPVSIPRHNGGHII